jgi:hypothetical protein
LLPSRSNPAPAQLQTVFDANGKLARTTPFAMIGGSFPSVIGTFADGSLLIASEAWSGQAPDRH